MTPKQTRFIAEYLANGLNTTKAAISAGYSEKTAASIGEENLRKPEISAAIQERTKTIMDRLEVTADLVIQEIARIAFFDPRKLFNDDGSLKMISEIDHNSAAALSGFEVRELYDRTGDQKHACGLLKKVKLADKSKNLEMLGRYFGFFTRYKENSNDSNGITTLIIDL